ncbi:MAG TPA: helix-turn-helix transcriptional regulator [Actinomycetota bacterium]
MDEAVPEAAVEARDLETTTLVVLTKSFPARASSFPDIRDFVVESLVEAPLTPAGQQELQQAVLDALLDAAGTPEGAIQVSFRIFPDHVEVDVLRTAMPGAEPILRPEEQEQSFAAWMAAVLKREGLTQEAAARQLGVSVRTVHRWVNGTTEPRLRDLRHVREFFAELASK